MIRPESFAASTEEFAATRRTVLTDAAAHIRPAAREALGRIGLPSWEMQIVDAALDVFDTTARSEVDQWGQVIDDMRDMFALEMSTTLQKTKRSQNPDYQIDLITDWAATYAVNAGTEAATTADPDEGVGLEWVTMDDDKVREPHREANGQTVPTGHAFNVGGAEMMYPGQPVGDPENWINCRCVVRPTLLTEASSTITASAEQARTESTVIVALPSAEDPVSAVSSEQDGAHATLLFLGDAVNLDEQALLNAIGEFVTKGQVTPVTDKVNGSATLGPNKADVVLLDAANLKAIRDGLLEQNTLVEAHQSVEQYPTWIPHVTLGYPETPSIGDYAGDAITFDRLALWHGNSRTEFQLGEPPVSESLTAAGDEPVAQADTSMQEFEDEMASMQDAESAFPDVPWHGVLAPEGVPSGDGRQFAVGALTNRDLPLPLKFQWVDADGHKGSFPVGRIDRIWREDGVVKAEGVFDSSPAGYETIRLLANGIMRGVSVDLDSAEVSPASTDKLIEFAKGRIASATICSIPAFAEAFVALGLWADVPGAKTEAVPAEAASSALEFDTPPLKTMDGPGWITDPQPTHKITSYWVDGRGALKIAWGAPGDFNRCRTHLAKYVQNPEWLAGLCANLHYRALGVWPGQASAATITASGQMDSLVASAALAKALPSADDFRDPQLQDLTPFTVEDDGRVYGHLAGWDTCHIGYEECVTAPPSETQYAFFLTGEVRTDAGPVAVGQISLGGGHAPGKFGLRAAVAHYDRTSAAVADVTCGEDMHGIWVAGRLRDGVTASQIHDLRAAAISGDWRGVRMRGHRSQELVAALAVNVPGFPIPRTAFGMEDGEQMSLVAAGVVPKAPVADADPERIQKLRELTFNIRDLHVADIKKQLTSLKGK